MLTKDEIKKVIHSKQTNRLSSDGWAEPTIDYSVDEPVGIHFPDVLEYTYELRYRVKLTFPKHTTSHEQALCTAVGQIHNELYGEIISRLARIKAKTRYSAKAEVEGELDSLLSDLMGRRGGVNDR